MPASGRRSAATSSDGRYIEARSRLARLSARWPEDGEVRYYLGDCESRLGDERAAVAAWSRIDDASPRVGLAAVRLARRALRAHRFAEAEVLMRKALRDRGRHAIEARETLVNLFKIQGRYREAERLVRDGSDLYPDKIGLLKELAQLGSINPHKLDLVRDGLDKAASASPDDDRVWLGRANLATRTGRYEEAAGWLDRCRRRPDDPAVWRGRLELAMATDDAAGSRDALHHLPGGTVDPAEVLELRAWFAVAAGDAEREVRALRRLLERSRRSPAGHGATGGAAVPGRRTRGIRPAPRARRSSTGPRRSTEIAAVPARRRLPTGADRPPGRGAGPPVGGPGSSGRWRRHATPRDREAAEALARLGARPPRPLRARVRDPRRPAGRSGKGRPVAAREPMVYRGATPCLPRRRGGRRTAVFVFETGPNRPDSSPRR